MLIEDRSREEGVSGTALSERTRKIDEGVLDILDVFFDSHPLLVDFGGIKTGSCPGSFNTLDFSAFWCARCVKPSMVVRSVGNFVIPQERSLNEHRPWVPMQFRQRKVTAFLFRCQITSQSVLPSFRHLAHTWTVGQQNKINTI